MKWISIIDFQSQYSVAKKVFGNVQWVVFESFMPPNNDGNQVMMDKPTMN